MLSDLVRTLIVPGNFVSAVLLLGVLLRLLAPRWSIRLLLAGSATMVLIATVPLGPLALAALEDSFPNPALAPDTVPERLDGIVVLGGFTAPRILAAHHQPALTEGVSRVLAFIELAKQHPEARLVFLGGSGWSVAGEDVERSSAQRLMRLAEFDSARVTFESRSLNTGDSVVNGKALLQPQPGETWLLITSAAHMPRSVAIFRAADWPVIPYPVDYRTAPDDISVTMDLLPRLEMLTIAAHEWVGLLWYRFRGRAA